MIRTTRFALSASTLLATLAFGGVSLATASAFASPQGVAAGHREHHVHQAGVFTRALALASLTDAQRTQVQDLANQEKAADAPIKDARMKLRAGLADQVAQGKIDRAALAPQVDAEANAILAERTSREARVNTLNGILTPDQRTALGNERGGGFHGEDLGRWEAALNLTPAQKEQITTAFRAEMKNEHTAAAPAAGKPDAKAKAERESARIVAMAEAALPVLTPAQRTVAATLLRTPR